jgi:hypothetical protein
VYIEVVGDAPARPYWLVGSRHADELASAIDTWQTQARAGDPSVA